MRKSGPPRGLISYIVLELLEEKPRYGYEILKEITDISGGHWEPSYGSVYPILYKFEEEGYAERIEREDEPDRKYFALTDEGHGHLAEKRSEVGGKARDFADVILGFYHMYVAFATDDRFHVDPSDDDWCFDGEYSGWIAEQVIRHHERDFGEFERVPDTPEEFHARRGDADAPGNEDEDDRTEDDGVDGTRAEETAADGGTDA
ncbi:PadR family transcriptional regulator [Halobaculum gomorrense]|uniref:Transcriptional regulator PadR-like family protein n=1 Tax=Halobaculum gomorrense TaxID=43928 RepID=A0A1M5LXM8_9EURY|nr:PadR family transcriptional regulator [Halobaculum gomorrense]SHG69817.1 Transcriptional regulator PadR-like family protein [Halobaculum gomorrense]